MLDLFEALGDGVVLIDQDGQVLYANRAARERLAVIDDAGELASGHACTLARWLEAGLLENGASTVLDDVVGPGGEPISASVHRFGRAGHVGLVLRPGSARETWEAAAAAWAASLSGQLDDSLGRLLALLESHPARSLAGFRRRKAFAWALGHQLQQTRDALDRLRSGIDRRLQQALPQPAGPLHAESVSLRELVAGVLERLDPMTRRQGVDVDASVSALGSRAVLGNPFWLAWALDELIERLIEGLPGGSSLELSGYAEDNPVLILRVHAPAGAAGLRPLSADKDLRLATSVLEHYGGGLGLRCWEHRRLVVLRLTGEEQEARRRRPAGAAEPPDSAQLAAEVIERARRASAGSPGIGSNGGAAG